MKLGLHFWSGDYAGALTVVDEAIEQIAGMDGNPVMQLIHMTVRPEQDSRRAR